MSLDVRPVSRRGDPETCVLSGLPWCGRWRRTFARQWCSTLRACTCRSGRRRGRTAADRPYSGPTLGLLAVRSRARDGTVCWVPAVLHWCAHTSLPSHACHHTPRAHDTHAIALSLDEKPLWLVRYRLYLAEGSPPRVCVCCALHSVPPPPPISFCHSHALLCLSAGLSMA